MPVSMASNPMSFLQGAGGPMMPPQGPTGPPPMGGGPPGGGPDMGGGMMGGADMGGAAGGMPGGQDPLMALTQAAQIVPQVLAQQQSEYYKQFLKQIGKILREFARMRTIGPHTQIDVNRAVTQLAAAENKIDKERPEVASPVASMLATSMMQNRPQMGAQAGLPVQMRYGA